jgi:hypothetical protein
MSMLFHPDLDQFTQYKDSITGKPAGIDAKKRTQLKEIRDFGACLYLVDYLSGAMASSYWR